MGQQFLPRNNRQVKDDPLGSLDTNQYTYSNFIYPRNLGTEGLNHYVVFHINETTSTNFYTRNVGGNKPVDRPRIETNERILGGAFGPEVLKRQPNEMNTPNRDGSLMDRASYLWNSLKYPISRVATTIVLYMPPSITTNFRTDWGEVDAGVAGMMQEGMFGGAGIRNWREALANTQAGVIGAGLLNFGNYLATNTQLNVRDATSRAIRMTINPHKEVTFNGIGFRTFDFDFDFTPQTEEDAENVDNIIEAFSFYSVPEINVSTGGRFFDYPAEFDIQFMSNGVENTFLPKLSTCALRDVSIDYTASGYWAAFRSHRWGGAPPVYSKLKLSFMEIEILHKARMLWGNDGTGT